MRARGGAAGRTDGNRTRPHSRRRPPARVDVRAAVGCRVLRYRRVDQQDLKRLRGSARRSMAGATTWRQDRHQLLGERTTTRPAGVLQGVRATRSRTALRVDEAPQQHQFTRCRRGDARGERVRDPRTRAAGLDPEMARRADCLAGGQRASDRPCRRSLTATPTPSSAR